MDSSGSGSGDARNAMLQSFVANYQSLLTHYFARRARPEDVPDLVQDVFMRLAKLENLNAIEKPEQYLFTTASAALKDRARRAAVRAAGAHDSFDENTHFGAGLSPERVLQGRDAIRRLEIELRAMPELIRDVFVLRVFEGQKMADVARTLGISLRTAEKYYARAMARLSLVAGMARP